MDEWEEKIGAVLGNPELMGRIMNLAQSMGGSEPAAAPSEQPAFDMPDLGMVQKAMGLASGFRMDPKLKALIQALQPFVSAHRLQKLEKALQTARLARFALDAVSGSQKSGGG